MRFWRRDHDPSPSEASRARKKAERDLAAAKAETPAIKALAASLVEVQKINHLGQTAASVLRGEKP